MQLSIHIHLISAILKDNEQEGARAKHVIICPASGRENYVVRTR